MNDNNENLIRADKNFQLFKLMRKERFSAFISSSVSHNRLLITISSALFGFSIAILRYNPNTTYFLLHISWIFLTLTMALSLFLFWISYRYQSNRMLDDTNQYLYEKKSRPTRYKNLLLIFGLSRDICSLLGFILFLVWIWNYKF